MKTKLGLLLMALVLTGCPFDEMEKCVDAQINAEIYANCSGLKGEQASGCKKETKISMEATGRLLCLKARAGH
jgi:hypothetical protein